MTLTDAELDALEQLAAAATAGPWDVLAGEVIRKQDQPSWYVETIAMARAIDWGTGEEYGDSGSVELIRPEDAAFIAAARESVPRLIAALRDARALLAEVVAREIADEGWCAFCGFTFDNHAAGCLWVKARAYLQVAKCTSASPNAPAL